MNVDILYLVADCIEPNPLRYCKLATVSRDFYSVFTSNRVWRYLNPYGHKESIYRHFLENAAASTETSRYWIATRSQPKVNANLYCWLGYLARGERPPLWLVGDPRDQYQLIWCAVNINSRALLWASERLRDNREVVLSALLKNHHTDLHLIRHISERLSTDDEILFLSQQIAGVSCN